MSKRRAASELLFGNKRSLRHPAKIIAVLTGTGTEDVGGGQITVVASDVATTAYIAITTDTNIGTLVGTSSETPTFPSNES